MAAFTEERTLMRLSGRSLIFAWLVTVAAAAPGTVVSAQTPILPILDHIHLNVPDQAKARRVVSEELRRHADDRSARPPDVRRHAADFPEERQGAAEHRQRARSPRLLVRRSRRQDEGARSGRREGRDAGARRAGLFKLAFVEDPWGTRIEVVQDPEKLGLHHVHLRAPDPAATLAWYKEKFGGDTAKLKDRIDGLQLQRRVDSRAARRRDAERRTRHRSHRLADARPRGEDRRAESAGREVHDRAAAAELASGTMVNFAYLEGPAGAKIELVQR